MRFFRGLLPLTGATRGEHNTLDGTHDGVNTECRAATRLNLHTTYTRFEGRYPQPRPCRHPYMAAGLPMGKNSIRSCGELCNLHTHTIGVAFVFSQLMKNDAPPSRS